MRRKKSLAISTFTITTVVFASLLLALFAYAHGTTVNVSVPDIDWEQIGSSLKVSTNHPFSFSSSHNVTARIDVAFSVPSVPGLSKNATQYFNDTNYSGGAILSRTKPCTSGNHTIYATSDIEADLVTDAEFNYEIIAFE